MFKGLFKRSKPARTITSLNQLMAGDLIQFGDSFRLPADLNDRTLTVEKVTANQYIGGVTHAFSLKTPDNQTVFASIEEVDGEELLVVSKVMPRADVVSAFNEDDIASLWDPSTQTTLTRQAEPDSRFKEWLTQSYRQDNMEQGIGFHYARDCRVQACSDGEDDDGEEFRYFELSGDNPLFSLSLETWGDGETDVCVNLVLPLELVSSYWPAEQK